MNVIFDKNSLKVISIFDNKLFIKSEADSLKQMFPSQYSNLSLWQIDAQISQNLVHLRVVLDSEKKPLTLLYKNKEVYRRSVEEEKKLKEKTIEDGKKELAHVLPRSLKSSLNFDIIKIWKNSPRTHPNIRSSLNDYKYFSDKKIMPVEWSGPFTDAGGYANMNREILFRLHNYHIVPRAEIWPTAPQISELARYYLSKYNSFDFRRVKSYPKIHSFTPHPVQRHNGRLIFFTMMETESLHPEFVRVCNGYADEIWTPSSHNQRVFKEYGVKKQVHVMPLGIDEILYSSNNSEIGVINDTSCLQGVLGRPISSGINSFRFLTLFGWSYRKGTDILIKSFVEEFTDDDDVALIICARHAGSPDPAHQNVIRSEIMRYAQEVRGGKYPQIILHPSIVSEKDMPALYRMGHAFVHFSRGEGFSLPQIEAAACNLPVISCNNTGMGEYLRDDNAYLVKTEEKELCSPEMHWISHFYHGQLFPKLGRDQIDQARKHMRFVRCNHSEALQKGKVLKQLVFSKYTWDKAAERVARRIEEINRLNRA